MRRTAPPVAPFRDTLGAGASLSPLPGAAPPRHIRGMSHDHSLAAIEAIARRTVDTLPAPFRTAAREVLLRVVDWPEQDMLDDLGIDDPRDLTGLYEGIPMTDKSVMDMAPEPDVVWLFREPILDEWRDRGDVSLEDLVTHVTIHEFAHHFGWSDEEIAEIDRWWE